MRLWPLFTAFRLAASNTRRAHETRAGMRGLRHKPRHKIPGTFSRAPHHAGPSTPLANRSTGEFAPASRYKFQGYFLNATVCQRRARDSGSLKKQIGERELRQPSYRRVSTLFPWGRRPRRPCGLRKKRRAPSQRRSDIPGRQTRT
jgi:hypothetical protein